MTGTTKPQSGRLPGFRRRVPKHLLEIAPDFKTTFHFPASGRDREYNPPINPGKEIKLSLRTRDPEVYKQRSKLADQQCDELIAKMGGNAPAIELYQLESYARQVFNFIQRVMDDPRGPIDNISVLNTYHPMIRDAVNYDQSANPDYYRIYKGKLPFADSQDVHTFVDKISEFDEERMLPLYKVPESKYGINDFTKDAINSRAAAATNWWLALHDIVISENDRDRLYTKVDEIIAGSIYIGFQRKDSAEIGNASNTKTPASASAGLSIMDLFPKWELERDYIHNTSRSWKPIIMKFNSFVIGKDIAFITRSDVVRWKDYLLKVEHKSANNVRDNYLKAVGALLNYAVRNELITASPLKGPIMKAQSASKTDVEPYSDREISIILTASKEVDLNHRNRWISWLLAATGARPTEITQLGSDQIIQVHGIWCVDIRHSSDGGPIKNKMSIRKVPLHRQLIEDGFLDYVASKTGPLFYREKHIDPESTHPSASVASSHSDWVKKLANKGVDFTNKSPNHSFRRWFTTHHLEIDVKESITDRIQAHKIPGERNTYVGNKMIGTMQTAVNKIDFKRLLDSLI